MSMELVGRRLQVFVLDLTESLPNSPGNLYSIPSGTPLTPYRHADGVQSNYGGIRAQHLPTVTDVLTEISRDPHRILPESLHPNTESFHHPDGLLPVTCQESFAL